jgi:hypothetical protein
VFGADVDAPATPGIDHLIDAGPAQSDLLVPVDLLLAIRSTGRSPPSAA